MEVKCCDFCMKILKGDYDRYTYKVNDKEYELCEDCYDDLYEIDRKKKEEIDRAKDIFVSELNKLLERKYGQKDEETKEDNI